MNFPILMPPKPLENESDYFSAFTKSGKLESRFRNRKVKIDMSIFKIPNFRDYSNKKW